MSRVAVAASLQLHAAPFSGSNMSLLLQAINGNAQWHSSTARRGGLSAGVFLNMAYGVHSGVDLLPG